MLALGKEVTVSKGYRTLSPYPFVTTFLFQKICQIPHPCTVHACQLIHIFYVPSITTILPILPPKDIPHFQLNPCYSRHRDFKQTLKNSTLVWKYQPPFKSNPSSKNLSNTAIIRFLTTNVISMAFQLSPAQVPPAMQTSYSGYSFSIHPLCRTTSVTSLPLQILATAVVCIFFLILNINQKNLKSKEFKNQGKKVLIKKAFKICYYL